MERLRVPVSVQNGRHATPGSGPGRSPSISARYFHFPRFVGIVDSILFSQGRYGLVPSVGTRRTCVHAALAFRERQVAVVLGVLVIYIDLSQPHLRLPRLCFHTLALGCVREAGARANARAAKNSYREISTVHL